MNTNDITVTKHVTTNFVDDGEVVTSSSAPRKDDDICIRDTSIADYLARPYLSSTITLTSSSLPNTVLGSWEGGLTLASNSQWLEKIRNYGLVRGTFCIKVTSNATPFMQYRLLLHFLPCTESTLITDTSYVVAHNANLATKTTQHHVELDARGTSVVMKMPYITPYSFYDRTTLLGNWGTYYLTVISPFATGTGDVSATLSVYTWFEDFELAAPMVPQSDGNPRVSSRRKLVKLDKETVDKPISTSLKAITIASDALSVIPSLTGIATTVSWAANIAAGVASYFGYSKIPLASEPVVVVNQLNRYAPCSDGIDSSVPMTLTHDNRISFSDMCVPDGIDESSFVYLKSIYSLTRTITWAEADSSSTLLVSQPINPYSVGFISNQVRNTKVCSYISGPPITTLSKLFNQWRGGIRVRLSFVKTQFHTGRLEVVFTPSKNLVFTPTLFTSTASLREIVDLSSTNELELILPYYMNQNYLGMNENSGHLTIRVLNGLRSPDTVSNSVPILMYFSGASDFEFQCPCPTNVLPFSPQSGAGVDMTASHVVGGDPSHSISTKYSESSVGEHFTSVRQLLSRFSPYRPLNPVSNNVSGESGIFFWPWARGIVVQSANGNLSGPEIGGDIFSYIFPMYAMYRGSMLMYCNTGSPFILGNFPGDVVTPAMSPIPIQSTYCGDPGTGLPATNYFAGLTTSPYPKNSMGSAISIDNAGANYRRVPYYCRTHSSFAYSSSNTGMNTYADDTQPTHGLIAIGPTNNSINTSSFQVSRAVADDFQLLYFIGTIPYLVSYA
nr:MAG: polyprotein 2 [Picornavirales sp.]